MSNPWELINLNDYENHMSLNSVYQLQTLNEMMKKQFNSYDVTSAMVLGVAGGNGIEHITKEKFQKVYGVDVNKTFLTECQNRFKNLEGVFETICADLSEKNLILPNAEFLIANLLIEYIGYECFQNIVKTVKPKYVSCVIQLNTDTSFVSDSPYIHTFDCLEEVHHQMEETELINYMQMISYKFFMTEEKKLPNGKKFLKIDFTIKEAEVSI